MQPEALNRGSYRDDYSKWGEPSVWFRIPIHLDLSDFSGPREGISRSIGKYKHTDLPASLQVQKSSDESQVTEGRERKAEIGTGSTNNAARWGAALLNGQSLASRMTAVVCGDKVRWWQGPVGA